MLVRAIVHFKNERLRSARIRSGYKTICALAEATGIRVGTLREYETFGRYPRDRKTRNHPHKQILETVLGVPADILFDDEYKAAVNQKQGRRMEFVKEVVALPSWATGEGFMLPVHDTDSDQRDLSEAITESMKSLTGREGSILAMRFGLGDDKDLSLEEVAERVGVTRERIRQIEGKALRKLKHPSRSRRLKTFLPTKGLSIP